MLTDIAPEDLADADLRRSVRLVLVADHPEGDHASRVVEGLGSHLDESVERGIQPKTLLLFSDHCLRVEPVLTNVGALSTGVHTRL
jgi:hypothetical protein